METITSMMWTWDSENKRMVNREIKYVPGFFKIVDEILVNAADNKVSFAFITRLPFCTPYIKASKFGPYERDLVSTV